MPPPPLPHRSTGAPCPLTPRQLLAFERHATGWPLDLIADELDLTPQGLDSLLDAAQKRLVRRSRKDATQALMEAGWITHRTEVNGLAANFLACLEAYMAAPLAQRDDMLVGDLYRLATREARHPPCSWVAGLTEHEGEVTETDKGRPLCAAHHAELERARARRSAR